MGAQKNNPPPPPALVPPLGEAFSTNVYKPEPIDGFLPPALGVPPSEPPPPGTPPLPPPSLKLERSELLDVAGIPFRSNFSNPVMTNMGNSGSPTLAFLRSHQPPDAPAKELVLIQKGPDQNLKTTKINLQTIPGFGAGNIITAVPGSPNFSRSLITADCNNDNYQDLFFVMNDVQPMMPPGINGKVSIAAAINRGTDGGIFEPRFLATLKLGMGVSAKTAMTRIADMNDDGAPDVILMVTHFSGSAQIFIFAGMDDGLCGMHVPTTPDPNAPSPIDPVLEFNPGENPVDFEIADMNNDHRPDIVVAMNGGPFPTIEEWDNTGHVPFAFGDSIVAPGPIENMGILDFNNDGWQDLAYVADATPFMAFNSEAGYQPPRQLGIPNDKDALDLGSYNVDACGGPDIVVLEEDGDDFNSLAVWQSQVVNPPLTKISPEVITAKVGQFVPLEVRAAQTPETPSFLWRVLEAPHVEGEEPTPLPIMNALGPKAGFFAKEPGTYRFLVEGRRKPDERVFGPNRNFCSGQSQFAEFTVEVEKGDPEKGDGLGGFAVSPTQYIVPGTTAHFSCGIPTKEDFFVRSCNVEQTGGQTIDLLCDKKIPHCSLVVPDISGDLEQDTLTFDVTPNLAPKAEPSHIKHVAEDTEGNDLTEEVTMIIQDEDEDDGTSDIDAAILKGEGKAIVGGSNELEGECSNPDATPVWYADEPGQFEIADPSDGSTHFIANKAGEYSLQLVCLLTDSETGIARLSAPATVTINAVDADEGHTGDDGDGTEENPEGDGAVGGNSCSLSKNSQPHNFSLLFLSVIFFVFARSVATKSQRDPLGQSRILVRDDDRRVS